MIPLTLQDLINFTGLCRFCGNNNMKLKLVISNKQSISRLNNNYFRYGTNQDKVLTTFIDKTNITIPIKTSYLNQQTFLKFNIKKNSFYTNNASEYLKITKDKNVYFKLICNCSDEFYINSVLCTDSIKFDKGLLLPLTPILESFYCSNYLTNIKLYSSSLIDNETVIKKWADFNKKIYEPYDKDIIVSYNQLMLPWLSRKYIKDILQTIYLFQ